MNTDVLSALHRRHRWDLNLNKVIGPCVKSCKLYATSAFLTLRIAALAVVRNPQKRVLNLITSRREEAELNDQSRMPRKRKKYGVGLPEDTGIERTNIFEHCLPKSRQKLPPLKNFSPSLIRPTPVITFPNQYCLIISTLPHHTTIHVACAVTISFLGPLQLS